MNSLVSLRWKPSERRGRATEKCQKRDKLIDAKREHFCEASPLAHRGSVVRVLASEVAPAANFVISFSAMSAAEGQELHLNGVDAQDPEALAGLTKLFVKFFR